LVLFVLRQKRTKKIKKPLKKNNHPRKKISQK